MTPAPIGVETAGAPDESLQNFAALGAYIKRGRTPWPRLSAQRRARLINQDVVPREAAGEANGKPFPLHDNHFLSGRDYQRVLYARFRDEITHAAIDGLAEARPEESAKRLFSTAQLVSLAAIMLGITALGLRWPLASFLVLNAVTTVYFISAIFFRLWLLALGWKEKCTSPPPPRVDDAKLPIITILLPLYRDAACLPMLAKAVDGLDYPASKKDVKLLLEEDDQDTIAEARRLGLDQHFETILAPARMPRTKPKACNIGLYLARGELIVIYDAEDLPESDQLRKAAAAFHERDASLACVQARLNYYNRNENWLTRMFTLEYSLWFDWLLPALQKMDAPIPLGGTSNFFRTDALVDIGGWDPFNVTEDADLGLRLARLGYQVEVISSTTFEEANCDLNNWVRQRSRWLKGYVQTWLVHMRRPQRIIAATGWRGFLAVQLFVAGNVFSAVINPLMWAIFLGWIAWRPAFLDQLFPAPIIYLNLFALVFGNLFFIAMMMIGPMKRGWSGLAFYGLSAPAYWLLTSFAAYKALWQVVFRPHYWEKTDHVISKAARQKRADALESHFAEEPQTTEHRHVHKNTINARRTAIPEDERPR